MKTIIISALISLALPAATVHAQTAVTELDPISTHARHTYDVGVRQIVIRAAEMTPAEHYDSRPVESVRTFGEIVQHIADSQYVFCSVVLGEASPAPKSETTAHSKPGLIAALNDAFDYCARAHRELTAASGAESVRFMGSQRPKLGVLSINTTHTIEHYGNLVTYMRIKGLVPPTSDPDFMKSLRR